ncbi:MAG: hypothetical protein QOH15_1882 [Gaiellales bacterium]|jgi:hypothetical protein|nr:hypothetical protein [Gaiellales bacterium]
MDVERLADGLWRWSVEPGRWSVYVEAPEAIVLVDPLLPPPGSPAEARFFEALDRDVRRLGRPVRVVETSAGRGRDSARIRGRYPTPGDDARGEEDDRDPDEPGH